MLGNLDKLSSSDRVQTNWKERKDFVDDEDDGDVDEYDDDDDECILISHDTRHLHRYCCQRGWSVGRVLQRCFQLVM